MLTYQLQRRVLMKKDQKDFIFPNDVQIELMFEPSSQFGNAGKKGKTVKKGTNATMYYDGNTGKNWVCCKEHLEPLDVGVEWTNLKLILKGNKLFAEKRCETGKELQDLLNTLHYILPILLTLELAEPVVVKYTKGKIGDAKFGWELQEKRACFDVADQDLQEKRVLSSFLRLPKLSSRRLAAANYYFYVARRLSESGYSQFEFMAEIVLNLCKVLQVLFGETRDDVRRELIKCGYSKKEIEKNFITLMVLRAEFDVGHVSLRIFKQKQLDSLYRFLEDSETNVRKLLQRIIAKVHDEEYFLKPDPDPRLTGDKLKIMNKLLRIIEEF
jgi:hypothetical protein